MLKTAKLLEEIGRLREMVVADQTKVAASRIRELAGSRLPRPALAPLAYVARRADLYEVALKLLTRVMSPSRRDRVNASDFEIAEYAMALGQLGARQEAELLLEEVDAKAYPNALFYRVLLLFSQHDYDRAFPLGCRYLENKSITELGRRSMQVRLAHALALRAGATAANHREAQRIARQQLGDLETERRLGLVARYARTVLAWSLYLQGDESAARRELGVLRSAAEVAGDVAAQLDAGIWLGLLELRRSARSLLYDQARAKLVAQRQWELVRRADFYRALARKDARALTLLYVGSPYPAFREAVAEHLASVPERYIWRPESAGVQRPVRVTLEGPSIRVGNEVLRAGRAPARAFEIFCRDFYCPLTLLELFSLLYPGEKYDPWHSGERAHRILRRLRHWLRQRRLPLTIEAKSGFYSLKALQPCEIELGVAGGSGGPALELRVMTERMRRRFGATAVSSAEVAGLLGLGERSARGYLAAALKAGLVSRSGKGPATRYRLS